MTTITEQNKLIAEFMGAGYVGLHGKTILALHRNNKFGNGFNYVRNIEELMYHTSWDWLMPVVEKIEELLPDDSFITIEYKKCIIPVNEGEFDIIVSSETKLKATYLAVVDFITWYNENK